MIIDQELMQQKYEPLFSFYDYFQDSINDIAYYANSNGTLFLSAYILKS